MKMISVMLKGLPIKKNINKGSMIPFQGVLLDPLNFNKYFEKLGGQTKRDLEGL